MNMDVIAQLGRTAGRSASDSRFASVSDNLDVVAGLAKIAAEKQASWGMKGLNALWSGVKNTGTGIKNTASVIGNNPIKSTAILGGGGAALGYNAYEHSHATPGRQLLNPMTWFNPTSEADAYRYNQINYQQLAQPTLNRLTEATQKGDQEAIAKWQGKLDRGDFAEETNWDPRKWTVSNNAFTGAISNLAGGFGFNPFNSPGGAYYQRGAMNIQNKKQQEYDKMMGGVGPQQGDWTKIQELKDKMKNTNMMPQQAQAYQAQLNAIQQRQRMDPGVETDAMTKLRTGAEGVGMRIRRPDVPNYNLRGWGPGQTPPPLQHQYAPSKLTDWSIYKQDTGRPNYGQ